ncbi:MAG: hypothetical protein SPL76_01740 [Cyanobacteriota bacterium]|nr:hypothetical protein [Cyanobacteriota bacterium]
MRTKLLVIAFMSTLVQVPAMAAISVDHTMTQDFLQNNGYSKQIYDTVNVSRARALGEEYYSSEELEFKNSTPPVRWWKKFHAYLDPAKDDYSFYHHDTNPEPSASDL